MSPISYPWRVCTFHPWSLKTKVRTSSRKRHLLLREMMTFDGLRLTKAMLWVSCSASSGVAGTAAAWISVSFCVCGRSVGILEIFTQRVSGISQAGNHLEMLFQENSHWTSFSVILTLLQCMQEILISSSFSKWGARSFYNWNWKRLAFAAWYMYSCNRWANF